MLSEKQKQKHTKSHWQIQIEGPSAGGGGSQVGTKRAELTLRQHLHVWPSWKPVFTVQSTEFCSQRGQLKFTPQFVHGISLLVQAPKANRQCSKQMLMWLILPS